MPHLPPAHHETSKRVSPNKTKIKEKQNETIPNSSQSNQGTDHLVSHFDGEIEIAGATEHAQVLIEGGDSMEGKVWTGRANRLGREVVQQTCGSVEPFYPVASQNKKPERAESAAYY
jgi:hypothetical protein